MAFHRINTFQTLVDNIYMQRCEKVLIRSLSECIRCGACERACEKRHHLVRLNGPGVKCGAFELAPVCRNCASPACVHACPRRAIFKEGPRVVVDPNQCVGCGLCASACVFSAIRIDVGTEADGSSTRLGSRAGCAAKCDRCRGERHQACVRECPTGALRFLPFKQVIRMVLKGPMSAAIQSPIKVVEPAAGHAPWLSPVLPPKSNAV